MPTFLAIGLTILYAYEKSGSLYYKYGYTYR